jgi:predicted SAM-dependent methyltransferase
MPDILQYAKNAAVSFKRFVKRFHQLDRETIANLYLKGTGIEIGALHCPLILSREAQVKYVDMLDSQSLRKKYPELENQNLVDVDIVDDGETLKKIGEANLDFVIANHFLEHCQNPILALKNFIRVLKPGGVLYLAIPDKRYTFDVDRQTTSLQHLLRDYSEGPSWSRIDHLREWLTVVDKRPASEVESMLSSEEHTSKLDIHWHVWTQREMIELVNHFRDEFGYEVQIFLQMENESIFILLKN